MINKRNDKMQKYIRGLLYGNKKTKAYLSFLVLLFLLTVVSFIYTILFHSIISAIIAVFAGVLLLVLGSSFSFQQVKSKENAKSEQDMKQTEEKNAKQLFATEPDHDPEKKKTEQNMEKETYFHQYSEQKLQMVFKEHKVKKNNLSAIVDFSEKYKIKECPAYIWRDKNNFYILLLEKKARKIILPLHTLKYIHYQPGVQADVKKDYKDFQENSFIGKMFGNFLPSYYNGQGREAYSYKKNLYVIAPEDICFTNTSARNLMKILNLNVDIKHTSLEKEEYSQHYQMIYQYNVLWKDSVITIEEYQDKVKKHLKMIADSPIDETAYRTMIMKFMKYRWITDEYAQFFLNYKEKTEKKKQENKK